MTPAGRCGRRALVRVILVAGLCVAALRAVQAVEYKLASKSLNYQGAPVVITQSDVTLIGPSTEPIKVVVSDKKQRAPDQVYYLTQDEAGYRLKGMLICRNESGRTVEALQLAVVQLDAFYNRIQSALKIELSSTQQMATLLPMRTERQFSWERAVSSGEASAVAVVVTHAQFADSSVWSAPREELVDIF